ncbi:MAG: hypothetical protein NTW07_00150, partial [candidate division Zixibacteria bacterium]|nr:hypothetical protein [candidate division Zixibacteria bacterium]
YLESGGYMQKGDMIRLPAVRCNCPESGGYMQGWNEMLDDCRRCNCPQSGGYMQDILTPRDGVKGVTTL